MERGWWYKTVWETAPSEWRSFRERRNFPRIWIRYLRFRIWGLQIKHLKVHNLCDKGATRFFFFLSLIYCNFDDQLSSNFHRFVMLCIVEIHQVRRPIVSSVFKTFWKTFHLCKNSLYAPQFETESVFIRVHYYVGVDRIRSGNNKTR